MDDVPGMKAVLCLLMFPNYKPFGIERERERLRMENRDSTEWSTWKEERRK